MTACNNMKVRISFLTIVILLLCFSSSWGQQKTRVTGQFSETPFPDFVTNIENQTKMKFRYEPSWVDTLKVSGNFVNEDIDKVLQRVLNGTDLFFAVHDNTVFITRQRQILTQLPDDFFHEQITSDSKPVDFDYSAYEKREKEKKQAEERLYNIGPKSNNLQGKATLAGTVRDGKTGEPVVGTSVFVEDPMIGAITDQFGYYSITLPKGRHVLKIKSMGMKNTQRQIMLYSDGRLDVEIEEDVTPLKEVLVVSDRDARVSSLQMGMEKLDIKTMKKMPLALGETDILKVMLTLPGVQTVGEGTVGLNVRGGATNQNLILYNNAVVYNPSHLFGFFSTFNPDVLKNVELYKSAITADYGGRLSSVLDVHAREGNLKKISGSGGISPITGRFTIEGPIQKDRTSFLLGVRSTYSDWLLKQLDDPELKNSEASFYDLNASINHKVDDDNSIYLSAYMSQDKFKLNSDTVYKYSDRNASLTWKHNFNTRLYGTLIGSVSEYDYNLSRDSNPIEAFTLDFSIRQWNAKADFNYSLNSKHTLGAGAATTHYQVSPGNYKPLGNESEVVHDQVQTEQGQESAIYIADNFDVTPDLSIYAGLRYSFYHSAGPRDVYTYGESDSPDANAIVDTIQYNSGPIAKYSGLEPRISVRYSLSNTASLKFSYNRTRQYIQMLSNATAITPTDIWKLSDTYLKPQVGDQLSLGFYKNLRGQTIETSVEGYYKVMKNTLDFKGGADLILNHHIETDVLPTDGKAYGLEVFIKKNSGKVNGWISYTYSRSLLKTAKVSAEAVNDGRYYPSNYDKPHSVNFIGNYKFSQRFNISLNVTYSTGRPITVPIAKYELGGTQRVYYSDRNEFRIPDYFRTDFSINLEGNHKVKKLAHSSWTFAVYNLTGRENAYSVYFVTEGEEIKGYKLSIFARPIPTITYNFKF